MTAQLKADPIHKLLVGRDPVTGPALASQPTHSRFENAVGPRDLYGLTQTLADVVIAHHQARLAHTRVNRITIDLDPTDDPTHGQQELAFFNGHYDTPDRKLESQRDWERPGHGRSWARRRPRQG